MARVIDRLQLLQTSCRVVLAVTALGVLMLETTTHDEQRVVTQPSPADDTASSTSAMQAGPVEAPPAPTPIEALPPPAIDMPVAAVPDTAAPPAVSVPLAPAPNITARAYAVVDRSCGALLAGRDEHERLAPASLTKIVTALVVRDHTSLDERVDVEVSGSRMLKQGSSVMGIEPGQEFSVGELLAGLILPSGNDAALALASHVAQGDVARFVALMNEEARSLGMTDSRFSNPHGLDSGDGYSSAADMAIAGRAYLNDGVLAAIADTPTFTTWTGLAMKNGNKLLSLYPDAYGVKIGFTDNAHQTIVAAARRGDRDIIVSLLGSDDRYIDTIALLDWAFASLPPACPP